MTLKTQCDDPNQRVTVQELHHGQVGTLLPLPRPRVNVPSAAPSSCPVVSTFWVAHPISEGADSQALLLQHQISLHLCAKPQVQKDPSVV